MLANTTEIGTATLPRRRLTIPAPTDVSPSAPRRPPRFPALAWPALALLVLLAALALLGLLAHPSPASAQTDVWTATLTPADFGSGTLGCNNASATSKCSTATVLSDDDFTYDSTDYSVTTVFLTATAFTFTVDTDITAATNALTVVVGSTSLAFADANTQTARTRTWFNPGFSWTAGTAVSIRIPDTTPPELTSAAVAADGNSITVTFDESVDQTNLPAAGAFSVAADGAPVTVSGVSAGTAAQLVLALAAPGIRAGQVVTLGYTDPTAGDDTSAVQDTSGNDAVSFSDYSVTNNSIVVTVPSDWSLKPTGLAVGARFRLLFLSSTKRDGSSSDIADLPRLHPDPRRGRPRRHPNLQHGLPGARLHRRRRRPRHHLHHLHQHRQGRPHLLAQRRQGRRPVRGFLRRDLGRRGQRQERVRHQRPQYLPGSQLPPHRLQR